jgi:hypothetical protein
MIALGSHRPAPEPAALTSAQVSCCVQSHLGGERSSGDPLSAAIEKIGAASGKNAGDVLRYSLPVVIKALGGTITEQQLLRIAEIAQASGENAGAVLADGLPAVIKALGGKITEQQLVTYGAALAEIAQASGENAGAVLEYGLPAVIKALGGKITEQQLLRIAEIAQGSGKNAGGALEYGLPAVIKALGGTITEQQLLRITEFAQASGEKAADFLYHGLPAVIKALGGTITEQQLLRIAEFAQASGENAHAVLYYGLPAVIKALGGTITEQQLVTYGAALAEIAQGSGEKAGTALEYGLPAVIEALGGKITEQQLVTYGAVLAEIAQGSGENARTVLKYGLPAVIEALGGTITEQQLVTYGAALAEIAQGSGEKAGAVLQYGLPAVIAALRQHSPTMILAAFVRQYAGNSDLGTPIPDDLTYAVEISAKLIPLVFGEDQKFETPKREFAARFAKWLTKEAAPVLTLPGAGIQFTVKGKAEAQDAWRLVPGRSIDSGLLNRLGSHFAPLSDAKRQDRVASLLTLAKVAKPAVLPAPGSEQEKDLIFKTLGTINDQQTLQRALKTLRPLLPELTGVTIPKIGADPTLEQIHSFLTAVRVNFNGHIPEALRAKGITIEAETWRVVFANFTRPIVGELDKLRLSADREQKTIKLVATKGIYDAFYDAIGENCAGQYGFALEELNFQPIRLIDPETNNHYGVVYVLKGRVDGNPALILAGVEIRKKYAYSISQTELIPKLIAALKQVAEHNKITGGVWTTVGKATEDATWSDDGRIAQYDVVRNALVKPGIAAFGDPRELEQIEFPPKFPETISQVVRVG